MVAASALLYLPEDCFGAICELLRSVPAGCDEATSILACACALPVESFGSAWSALAPMQASKWLETIAAFASVSSHAARKVAAWATAVLKQAEDFIATDPSMGLARAALRVRPHGLEARGGVLLRSIATYARLIRESILSIPALPGAALTKGGGGGEGGRILPLDSLLTSSTFLHVDESRSFDPTGSYRCPRLRLTCPLPVMHRGGGQATADESEPAARCQAPGESTPLPQRPGASGPAEPYEWGPAPLEWEYWVDGTFAPTWASFTFGHHFVDCSRWAIARLTEEGRLCDGRAATTAAAGAMGVRDERGMLGELAASSPFRPRSRGEITRETSLGRSSESCGAILVPVRTAAAEASEATAVSRESRVGEDTQRPLYRAVDEVHEAEYLAIGWPAGQIPPRARLPGQISQGATQTPPNGGAVQHAAPQGLATHPPAMLVEAAFLIPAERFLRLVRMAYGVHHPCGPQWRNRFFASLLEQTEYDAANEVPGGL